MNISTRTRVAGATATLGMLLAFTACGTETVSDTDPGTQPAAKPGIEVPAGTPASKPSISADTAERRAEELKARQERADMLRYQSSQLKYASHPGRP